MSKTKIQPVSEIEADKRRLCEIRFDCYVTMHDSGTRTIEGGMLGVTKTLPPQWFKSQSTMTLEEIKHQSHELIGLRLKQMLFELEQAIEKYESFR
jgi:hypothetical protein